MDHVEFLTMRSTVFQRVSLDKLEWIVFLCYMIDAHHVEACTIVSHRRAPSSTE